MSERATVSVYYPTLPGYVAPFAFAMASLVRIDAIIEAVPKVVAP